MGGATEKQPREKFEELKKIMKKNNAFVILLLFLAAAYLVPTFTFANGGDQRVVENKYLINLSRAPFTPRVGEKTAMLISFVDLRTDKLISEDINAKISIAKLGGSGLTKREFLFEKKDILVRGGVLEFPYTFDGTGLHEIFIDFALYSNPQKIYESPDFLMDVQSKESQLNVNRFMIGFILSTIAGVIFGFAFGLWLGQRRA